MQSKANLAPPDTHLFPFSKYLVDQAISTEKKIVRNVDIYVIDSNFNKRKNDISNKLAVNDGTTQKAEALLNQCATMNSTVSENKEKVVHSHYLLIYRLYVLFGQSVFMIKNVSFKKR